MRRVDEAPARIDCLVVEQPVDRTPAAPRQALGDLAGLLGDVNMDRRRGIERAQPGNRVAQRVGRHRA